MTTQPAAARTWRVSAQHGDVEPEFGLVRQLRQFADVEAAVEAQRSLEQVIGDPPVQWV